MLQHGLLKPVSEFLGPSMPLSPRLFSEKGYPGIQLLFCLNLQNCGPLLCDPLPYCALCKWIWWNPTEAFQIVKPETPSFAKGGDSALENVHPPSTWRKLEPKRDHLHCELGGDTFCAVLTQAAFA